MALFSGKRVPPRTRLTLAIVLVGCSVLSTLFGLKTLIAFDQTAGPVAAAPGRWPVSSAIKRVSGRPQLLLFVHPFCTCTVATMAELAQLQVRRKPGTIAPVVTFLFYRPRNSGWGPNDLWNKAKSIENAHAVWDDDGRESRRFGARTSGYALLYSAEGELLFGGGVTGSRGHEGDNDGLDLLEASLDSRRPSGATSRVFGCALGSWKEGKDGNR